jgi:hypothetical protein
MGLNLKFLSTSNGVQCQGVHQKNGFKKRIHQSILVKEGYQGLNIRVQLHVEEAGNQLLLSLYSVLLPALFGIRAQFSILC